MEFKWWIFIALLSVCFVGQVEAKEQRYQCYECYNSVGTGKDARGNCFTEISDTMIKDNCKYCYEVVGANTKGEKQIYRACGTGDEIKKEHCEYKTEGNLENYRCFRFSNLSNNHSYDEIIKDAMRSTTQVLTTEEASTTKETSTTGKVTTKKSTTRKISTAKSTTSRSSLSTTPKLNESTTTQEEPELKDYWGNYDNFYPKLLTSSHLLILAIISTIS